MPSSKLENARWGQAVSQATSEYEQAKDKILSEDAARGFPAPSGEGLSRLLSLGTAVKQKLVEANGKIYEEERGRIFELIEFDMKMAVQVAKLAMQLYREQLFNQVGVEQAQVEARSDRHRADVERLNTATEARQASIITAKAAAEHEVNGFRLQLVEAERTSLKAESLLINAQLETARVRLSIIDSIYQVIAAEGLVLTAERRKATALEVVIETQGRIAAIKEAMIPAYQAKAAAREVLADATAQDAEIRKEIEKLGFERNRLRVEQDEEHQIRDAELDYEVAKEALTRAALAEELARSQSRRLLQEYANQVKEDILTERKALEEAGIEFKLDTSLARRQVETDAEVALANHQAELVGKDLAAQLTNIQSVGLDQQATVQASGNEVYRANSTTVKALTISRL